jgi:hypothetical protein
MPEVVVNAKKQKGGKKQNQQEDDSGSGSRSNHQRLQAVELLGHLIKDCTQHGSSRKLLSANIDLISQVITSTVETSDSWKNKKVTKTSQVVNLFVKAARIIIKSTDASSKDKEKVRTQGALIVRSIEKACEKDKSMSNLKGKIKEIKAIIENA